MDKRTMSDFVASHGLGDVSPAGLRFAENAAKRYQDTEIPYAEIAFEVVFRGLLNNAAD